MKVISRQSIFGALSILALVPSITAVPPPKDATVKTLDTNTGTRKAVGSERAPVDGKDGIPKSGPFVETSAERKQKQSTDDDDYPRHPQADLREFNDYLIGPTVPQSNDGVMDDKSRSGPKDGTRGTEGGISEKSKTKQNSDARKKPDSPKEQPPLPHSEGTIDDVTNGKITEDGTAKKMAKPTDLPKRPYSSPEDALDKTIPDDKHRLHNHPTGSGSEDTIVEKADIVSPLHSLFLAFTMILFSEIGDKTFLVACLMAMRHDRLTIFIAAFGALVVMTVLSAVLGHAVPTLIPKWLTNFLAAGLFLVFGIKMLLEARNISPDEGVSEEMKEVEQELEEKEQEELRRNRRRSSISPYVLESGRGIRKGRGDGRLPSPPDSPISEASSRSSSPSRRSTIRSMTQGVNNLCNLLLSPVFVQCFVMTFLGRVSLLQEKQF